MKKNLSFLKNSLMLLFALAGAHGLVAQESSLPEVPSQVYAWNDMKVEQQETRVRRPFFKGSTTHLAHFEVHASTLETGKMPHGSHTHAGEEELVLIREGTLKVTIKEEEYVLGPGSIALILPGDEHGFSNAGDTPASYYIMKYRSHTPMNKERGQQAGGSFVVNWNDLPFNEHSRGGVRRYFNRPTAMCEYFEMHVTDLKAGLKSHDPHTHKAEEIILLLEGDAEEQIEEQKQKASIGDVIFLSSMIPHAIENIGDKTSRYFAFQWY